MDIRLILADLKDKLDQLKKESSDNYIDLLAMAICSKFGKNELYKLNLLLQERILR